MSVLVFPMTRSLRNADLGSFMTGKLNSKFQSMNKKIQLKLTVYSTLMQNMANMCFIILSFLNDVFVEGMDEPLLKR